ncbi:MAG: ATP-binding protein [Vicinamibacterales bacterium]
MLESLTSAFDTSGFPPRWLCGAWTPALGWTHIASDVAIWAAYFTIPMLIVMVARRRRDLPFRRVFLLFGAFILFCGTTHLIEAVIFWWPIYPVAGVVKAATAVVSWATVFAIIPILPEALALRSPTELEQAVAARTAELAAANAALQREVSDRRAVEERLRRSEERLRLAFDAGRMGTWDWELASGRLEWTGHLEEIHGLAPGTFEGTFDGFEALVHPDDRARVRATLDQAREDCADFEIEFRNPRPDGTVRWVSGRGSVICDAEGRPARMVGVGMEVTSRRRAEESARFLAKASSVLSDIVDEESALRKVANLAVPQIADWCVVHLAEPDGSLRRVALSHADPDRVQLALDLQQDYPPDRETPRGAYAVMRTGRTEFVLDIPPSLLEGLAKDARHLELLRTLDLRSFICAPLRFRGRVLGTISMAMSDSGRRYSELDVRLAEDLASRAAAGLENVRLYAALRDADRRKDEFLAVLAHELRNPLAPMTVGLQVLRRPADPADPDGHARVIAAMDRQLLHLTRLVDDLLDVARIARGKIEMVRETCDLGEVLERAVEMAEPIVSARQHDLVVDVPAEPLSVHVDGVRIAQVVSNLLNNAAKYSEPGKAIHLTATAEGGDAVIRVRDQGVGIPRERLADLFTLFGQGEPGDARLGGLGIGLYLVRMLVLAHGGTVDASSGGHGQGSEFVVRLPLAAREAPRAVHAAEAAPVDGRPQRILVVDDNRDSLETLAMLLSLHGHEVRTAADGRSAFEALHAFTPDVALLDIGLPDTDGYEVARRMRAAAGDRPLLLVAVTGWGGRADRIRSREAGFDEHLVKPIDWEQLQRILARSA